MVYCISCGQQIYQKAFLNCYVNISLFSKFFSIDFARWKSVGLPHIEPLLFDTWIRVVHAHFDLQTKITRILNFVKVLK